MSGASRPTIDKWIIRYARYGLDGPVSGKSPDGPRTIPARIRGEFRWNEARLGRVRLGGLRLVAAAGRKVLKRINALITDIQRNGNEGISRPEPLKRGLQGYWSRRITTSTGSSARLFRMRSHCRLPLPLRTLGRSRTTFVCGYRLHSAGCRHRQDSHFDGHIDDRSV
jgi:YoeB-like toxin of bacterial type II toxin-antitoxin system